MALEAALEDLCKELRQFRDVLSGLEATVVQDRPTSGEVILVDEVSDDVTEIDSLAKESLDAAEEALRSVAEPADAHRLRRALAGSQLRFLRISHTLVSRLLAYEQIRALVGFGRKRGPEWMAWVRAVQAGVDNCGAALGRIDASFLQCWQDIAERGVSGPISLNTTNIGQQITSDALNLKETANTGIT